ncbi:unnamed protein product, partial [Effrenium voratum]
MSVVPLSWRPKRRLVSTQGDMAFETETVELEAEVEAAWLLVPALLAGVAATVAMGGIMAFCRRRGEFEALASPAGDKRITVQ